MFLRFDYTSLKRQTVKMVHFYLSSASEMDEGILLLPSTGVLFSILLKGNINICLTLLKFKRKLP